MSKNNTKILTGVKAVQVVEFFDRNADVYNSYAVEFIDFDKVQVYVYDADDLTQEAINECFESAENTIFNAHLKN